MSHIVDKRFTPKDGAIVNRQKFIDRYKANIKQAIKGIIGKESIKDFKFKDKKIKIQADDLDLPGFEYSSEDGIFEGVSVGNKKYRKGDKINKPPSGQGKGKGGSNNGGGEDDFEFTLTEEEFATIFFEDLELPDLVKKQFTGDVYEIQRCGFSNTGGPSSLSIKQTIMRAFMRRFALKKKEEKDRDKLVVEDSKIIVKKKKKINFLEDVDLKYNHRDKVELPSSKAVMFCLMDVSGSMGETEKDIAKRFFLLLSMFLRRNYDVVDVVFIRHCEWAEECDEEVFFYGRETGGTVISTGYEKILDIINARYSPEQWNIYISQATDGDNFDYDNFQVVELLTKYLLPITQYYAYIEVGEGRFGVSKVFNLLDKISKTFNQLQVKAIESYSQIFEVFKSLFSKKERGAK